MRVHSVGEIAEGLGGPRARRGQTAQTRACAADAARRGKIAESEAFAIEENDARRVIWLAICRVIIALHRACLQDVLAVLTLTKVVDLVMFAPSIEIKIGVDEGRVLEGAHAAFGLVGVFKNPVRKP